MKLIVTTIRNLLTNNFLLKIAALIFAAIIWITVVNINDPIKTVTIYNVPINIRDENVITDNNQVYSFNNKLTVNVTVTGRRSLISNLTQKSFIAEASFKKMSSTNAIPVEVRVRYSMDKKVSIDNQSQSTLLVDIKDLVKKSYEIETNIIGEVAPNYIMSSIVLGKEQIEITAPETDHEKIAQVRVDLDVTDKTSDINEKLGIKLFDEKGERIKPGDKNNISLSQSKVKANATVNKTKRIPIIYELYGTPRNGYDVMKHSVNPEEILICGQQQDVDRIENIEITGDILDVTDIYESKEVYVNLDDYTPRGITVLGDSNVKLTINVEQDIYKNFEINKEDITIVNIPINCTAEIVTENIKMTLYGKSEYIKKIIYDELQPIVNVKGLSEGEHNVEVEVTLPSGIKSSGKFYAKVKISRKETENRTVDKDTTTVSKENSSVQDE